MPVPALPKISRGKLIRAKKEISRAAESQEHPIDTVTFIMILILAVIIDFLKLLHFMPIINVFALIFGFWSNAMLWVMYWIAGAKSTQALVVMLIGTLIGPVPFTTTLAALAVYLIMSPRFEEMLGKTAKIASKLPTPLAQAIAKAAKTATTAKKITQATT